MTFAHEPSAGGCSQPKNKGDGSCDDENNHAGCGYDGGDCCGDDVNKDYCSECTCKDPEFSSAAGPECSNPQHKGDGCPDEGEAVYPAVPICFTTHALLPYLTGFQGEGVEKDNSDLNYLIYIKMFKNWQEIWADQFCADYWQVLQ